MKGLETGKDKVKKICDALRRETLEPAIEDAKERLAHAERVATEIINAANEEAERIKQEARRDIERQQTVFKAALTQACKQAVEMLKQEIEQKLFNPELSRMIAAQMQDPQALSALIGTVVKAIEKEGLDGDFSIYIPASISARTINQLLTEQVKERLKEKSVSIGSFAGGIQVKLHKENLMIDISDTAVKELVAQYARKDLRALLFA